MTGVIIGHYPILEFWLVLITKSPKVDHNQTPEQIKIDDGS
jgi:hypothetical protein